MGADAGVVPALVLDEDSWAPRWREPDGRAGRAGGSRPVAGVERVVVAGLGTGAGPGNRSGAALLVRGLAGAGPGQSVLPRRPARRMDG